jgi:uncharacterized membrane protein (UPF0127 family)
VLNAPRDVGLRSRRAKPGSAHEPVAFHGTTFMKEISLRTIDGDVVCARCLVADSMFARMRGLLGRRGLESGEGLLLRPAPSIHTFFMRFPIDVVFIARDGEVVKVVPALKPWRTAGARGARSALELAAGEAGRRGIEPGTRLDLRVDASPPAVSS